MTLSVTTALQTCALKALPSRPTPPLTTSQESFPPNPTNHMTTIQNPTGPSLLNSNDVFSSIDFRSTALSMTGLAGMTVTVGDVIYTAGSNWLPKFDNPAENIAPTELADSLVEAINGTYENAPNISVITDKIGRANTQASAYHTNGIVHLVKRTSVVPATGSTVTGVTPSVPVPGPSSGTPSLSNFKAGTAGAVASALFSANTTSFDIENLSTSETLIILDADLDEFKVLPLMGTTLFGTTSNYTVKRAGTVDIAYQLKLNF